LSLLSALGEAAVSTCTGVGFKFDAGYLPLAAQPGSVISIAAVSKATGTLELAWTAPGLDGFLGSVPNGLYRVDLTSSASHVFSPGVFITEFSTSVTPGDPQRLFLAGLLPNTTYYTRIYLSDARKMVSEQSAASDESTLANLPASPELSAVYYSSVSFSWNIPAGDAEGYKLDASTTSFGQLFPGGVINSSMTDSGIRLTLTVTGLRMGTTHYFRLASMNWQGDMNYGTIIATTTLGFERPWPIKNLEMIMQPLVRRVLFEWSNQVYPDPLGVLVQMSTNPVAMGAVDGADYQQGDAFADGSLVISSAAGSSLTHADLLLNSTYYYRFSSRSTAHVYSVFVATECILDLPPMSPGALQASVAADRSNITLSWSGVTTNMDGSPFRFSGEPMELQQYNVFRATSIARPAWTLVATVPVSSYSVTVAIPDPAQTYFYRIAAVDSVGDPGESMVADTEAHLYALAPDGVSRLKIPSTLTRLVTPSGNPQNAPLFFAAKEHDEDLGGKIVKSVEFKAVHAHTGATGPDMRATAPDLDIVLRYETAGGKVVPGSLSDGKPSAMLATAISASEAQNSLGAYWYNGRDYVKVFGKVDPVSQTVTVNSAMPGRYQIRSLVRSSGVSFDMKERSNRVITPNGDGLNDYVTFTLDNPRDSAVSGRIYDLNGALVAEMTPGTQLADTLVWNGKSNGKVVPRGVYVYQIKAEGKVFNGTVVVIR
ncbi:MAG TPA: gliding motility-associated C-terminal domain-containing protein, partial [Bacteroidales bacterium]|nr:gliding motility-associated C-terminal domain-containing protein [Bacteroidales bacterium]